MNAPSPDDLFAEYLRRGEPARFAELHDLLRNELLRAAERLAPSRGAAEDLVQATFLGALESAGRFERGRKVVPWLVGILQNQARMMRWRAGRTPDPQRVAWPKPRDPAEIAAGRELDEALAHAFARLGPTYAPVMELHLRDEMSAQDIGKRLDRPAGTVRTQVVRGTAMLRSLLPAGIASLLLVRVSPGLDAAGVRELLLEHAARGRGSSAAWLRPRSFLFAAAGLIGIAAAWFAFGSGTDGGARTRATREQSTAANAGERGPGALVTTRADAPAGEPVERSLVAAPATAGLTVIVTHEGAPVSAVPVYVTCHADWRFHRHLAMSDAEGRAHFADLPAGRTLVAPQADRARYDEPMLELKPGERREHRVALDRPLTFEGRVVDTRGAPLAGAEVWLCDGDYQHVFGFGARLAMAAAADGRFAFTTAARHEFTHVQVTAPGHRASALHPLPRERGEQHVFALAEGGDAVQGTVVDAAGAPLAGMLVRAVHAGERSHLAMVNADGSTTSCDTLGALREVRTDDAGRFCIGGFDRDAMVALKVWEAAWARHDATVPAGSPPLVVTMARGATIHGRVVDQDGKPVVDAEVATEADGDDSMDSRAHTEPGGSYTLTGVTPGDAVTVTATSLPNPVDGSGGAGNATAQLRLAPGGRHEWNPSLAPGTAFRGTLAFSDGSSLADWTFELVAIDEIQGQNYFPVRLDDRSAFEVKNVPRARYWLQFNRPGCLALKYVVSWPLAERYDVVVPAHIARRQAAWCEAATNREARATGTVEIHGLDPQVLFGFWTFPVDATGTWSWFSGRFERNPARSSWTAALAPGQYELVVANAQMPRADLTTADQAISFAITAGQTTALHPTLQPGVPRSFRIEESSLHLGADNAFVEVRDANGKLVSRVMAMRTYEPAPGTFEASVALAPGRYRISVETDLGHRGALDFTVDSLTPLPEVVPLPVR